MTSVPSVRSARPVVVGAIVLLVLAGCTSGTSEARQADEAFVALEYVAEVETRVSRPGLPTNRLFSTHVTFVEGVTEQEQARTLDDMLVIARDELGSAANVGYQITVAGGNRAIDMDAVVTQLGEVGANALDLGGGSLDVSAEALRAYESPRGDT